MKKIKKLVFFLSLAISIISYNGIAATSLLWGSLKPGPYKVGFKLLNTLDYSRSSFTRFGRKNNLQSHARGRQIRIYLWYPVSSSISMPPILFEKYANSAVVDFAPYPAAQKDIFEFVELPLVRGLSKERLIDLLLKPAAAIKDAPEADGSFPLIIFGQGLFYESPISHVVLCEYLASFGFVVATCPLLGTHSRLVNLDLIDLETQVRDMEFVLSQGCRLPFVDSNRLGLIGFDLGSMSALLLQMRNADIDAFVSLDSGIMFEHNTRLLKQSPYYRPEKLRVPLMHITRTKTENENMNVVEDHSLFESAVYADISLLRFKDMRHVDFTSYVMCGMDSVVPFYWGPARGNPKSAYELMCRYALNFLKAHLYADKECLSFLKSDPIEHATPGVTLTIESKKGKKAPPSEDDFVNSVFTEGVDKAVQKVREFQRVHPDSKILEEKNFINLGYRFLYFLGKKDYAVEIFRLYCEIYPQSANAYDSLGEAYMMDGNKELAILNYQKSLDLNPDNKNAAEKLKHLRQKKESEPAKIDYFGQNPPGLKPEKFASGIISKDEHEQNGIFTPDGCEFYFTKVTENHEYIPHIMKKKNDEWGKAEVSDIYKVYKGGEIFIDPSGKKLFFRALINETPEDVDIFCSKKAEDGWGVPFNVGEIINSQGVEGYPSVSMDGTLYFYSLREDTLGNTDLYCSKVKNGEYTAPVNLGPEINTEYNEYNPSISPDGSYLIFNSGDRPDILGKGHDLFISFKKKDGSWSKSVNMGKEINSPQSDYSAIISADGKYIFFSSSRSGNIDIYWVDAKIIEQLRLEELR